MAQFMLALYDDRKGWAKIGPEEMQKAVGKYIAWGQKAFVRDSKRLGVDVGKVLRKNGGKIHAIDGPYSETKEILGGIYLIEAANYDEAVERTSDHPHLEYGGTIELRQLWSM